ncbi:ribosome recycling factor [Ahrensia sp. R2A130]|uniref:ribosome recycling factor n=1 Tax=Ahrensia sp. R2A130 TaxID=744979 RepID=UPI0001E0C992|nr:ribosome recycling factor [Ahrensia sp. R2A130]EFL90235.1 ribosome recycling factor [Ahrensia sp. R2A130]
MADGIDLKDVEKRMETSLASFTKDLGGLRTGRASASLLDPVMVDAYGQKMPINQVANVGAPEPKLITVQIWDKSMVGPVEKAVREAGLGLNPVVDGQNLRIPMPDLNEERRRDLVKVAKTYAEDAKVTIRHVRRDAMETLKKAEKDKEIGQDEARGSSEKVQKMTDDKVNEVDKVLATKEGEIMQV